VSVVVKEAEELVIELGEFALAGESSIVFHVVIQKMNSFGLEQSSQFRVFMDDVAKVNFVDFGVEGLVSDTGPEEHPG